jgi:hypothetical protein
MKRIIYGIVIVFIIVGTSKQLDAQCNLKETFRFDQDVDGCSGNGTYCTAMCYEPTCERCRLIDITHEKNCTEDTPYPATKQLYSGACMDIGVGTPRCLATTPVGDVHAADCFHTTTEDCHG